MSEQTLASFGAGETATVAEAPSIPEASWYYDDGVPGQGERPDFLEDGKTLAAQAKQYKELRKAVGAQKGAPDQYDFSEVQDFIKQDNPVIQDFIAFAKENRISQDAFGKTLKTWVDYHKSTLPDIDAEIAKLGPDGMQRVTTVQNWIKNNLSAEAVAALGSLPVRADVIKMLDEARQLHAHTQARVPAGDATLPAYEKKTVAQVTNFHRQNMARWETDPDFRAEITRMYEQAAG